MRRSIVTSCWRLSGGGVDRSLLSVATAGTFGRFSFKSGSNPMSELLFLWRPTRGAVALYWVDMGILSSSLRTCVGDVAVAVAVAVTITVVVDVDVDVDASIVARRKNYAIRILWRGKYDRKLRFGYFVGKNARCCPS